MLRKERARELIALSERNEREFALWYRGRETEVLLETEEKNGYMTGLNREYVRFLTKGGKKNQVVTGQVVMGDEKDGPDLVVAKHEKIE